jgi:hypothetical protein
MRESSGKDITGKEPVREKRKKLQTKQLGSALVTIRALFGIELVGGHPEHVVALDADPMQHRRCRRRFETLWLLGRFVVGGIHPGGILSRVNCRQPNGSVPHPGICPGHLHDPVMRLEKMVNLLIDFRLSIRSTIQASARNPERQAPAKPG